MPGRSRGAGTVRPEFRDRSLFWRAVGFAILVAVGGLRIGGFTAPKTSW